MELSEHRPSERSFRPHGLHGFDPFDGIDLIGVVLAERFLEAVEDGPKPPGGKIHEPEVQRNRHEKDRRQHTA